MEFFFVGCFDIDVVILGDDDGWVVVFLINGYCYVLFFGKFDWFDDKKFFY